MKPAGVFEVCPTPINYDIYTDWIQAGETFHLSEGLRGLIARDAYPHFQGYKLLHSSSDKELVKPISCCTYE